MPRREIVASEYLPLLWALLALVAGGVAAWLALLSSFFLPTDSTAVELGVSALAVMPAAGLVARKSWPLALTFACAALLTLMLFGWLFWSLGAAMEDF